MNAEEARQIANERRELVHVEAVTLAQPFIQILLNEVAVESALGKFGIEDPFKIFPADMKTDVGLAVEAELVQLGFVFQRFPTTNQTFLSWA